MKKILLGSLVMFGFLVLSPSNAFASSEEDQYIDGENYVVMGADGEEVTPLSEVTDETFEFEELEGPDRPIGPQTRSASGYTYKNHTVLSTNHYANKLLKTLKTSNVWNTASNSLRPTISLTVSKTNSVSVSLSNGTGNFTFSQNVSMTSSQSYSAQPNMKGNKVSIGLYASKITSQRVRVSAYSNGSGKFSHYVYSNPTTVSGVYVGHYNSKG